MGEILDTAEKKLLFFQRQLNYEATDDRVTQHLRESYSASSGGPRRGRPERRGSVQQQHGQ
uniref:Uncharacterized protein n=1 Tax=Streptomyces avermitilis TaxID=33903 RepID=A0A499VRA2_STRAX|nr:hypothetical protein SAVMC3_89710 [Streptomyces avermitilis]